MSDNNRIFEYRCGDFFLRNIRGIEVELKEAYYATDVSTVKTHVVKGFLNLWGEFNEWSWAPQVGEYRNAIKKDYEELEQYLTYEIEKLETIKKKAERLQGIRRVANTAVEFIYLIKKRYLEELNRIQWDSRTWNEY